MQRLNLFQVSTPLTKSVPVSASPHILMNSKDVHKRSIVDLKWRNTYEKLLLILLAFLRNVVKHFPVRFSLAIAVITKLSSKNFVPVHCEYHKLHQ